MAKQIITMLTDDLDGGEAADTVRFGLDGSLYEIDLSETNAKALRDFLDRFVQAGTRTGRMPTSGYSASTDHAGRSRQKNGVDQPSFRENKELNNAIRAWAAQNGYSVAERGRIPQHVVDSYHSGTSAKPNPLGELSPSKVVPATRKADPDVKRAPAVSFKPEKTATPVKATRSRARATTA